MNTKFILHGGYAGRSNLDNDKFFKEILKHASQKVKILLVYFAKEEDEHQRMQMEDTAMFEKNKGDHDISVSIASSSNFIIQVEQSDVIYLHGGNTFKLLEKLKKYPNLKEIIKGKVIIGESAGAYALSTCFYSKTEGGISKGLGFIPVKVICHYTGENQERLKECSEGLETIILSDYEYKVLQYNL